MSVIFTIILTFYLVDSVHPDSLQVKRHGQTSDSRGPEGQDLHSISRHTIFTASVAHRGIELPQYTWGSVTDRDVDSGEAELQELLVDRVHPYNRDVKQDKVHDHDAGSSRDAGLKLGLGSPSTVPVSAAHGYIEIPASTETAEGKEEYQTSPQSKQDSFPPLNTAKRTAQDGINSLSSIYSDNGFHGDNGEEKTNEKRHLLCLTSEMALGTWEPLPVENEASIINKHSAHGRKSQSAVEPAGKLTVPGFTHGKGLGVEVKPSYARPSGRVSLVSQSVVGKMPRLASSAQIQPNSLGEEDFVWEAGPRNGVVHGWGHSASRLGRNGEDTPTANKPHSDFTTNEHKDFADSSEKSEFGDPHKMPTATNNTESFLSAKYTINVLTSLQAFLQTRAISKPRKVRSASSLTTVEYIPSKSTENSTTQGSTKTDNFPGKEWCNFEKTSCLGRCGVRRRVLCSCDQACLLFRDCCEDYFVSCTVDHPHQGMPEAVASDGLSYKRPLSTDGTGEQSTQPDTKLNITSESGSRDNTGDSSFRNISLDRSTPAPPSSSDVPDNTPVKPTRLSNLEIEVLKLAQSLDVDCVNETVVFAGCAENSTELNVALLEPFGLKLTGDEVRERCLSPRLENKTLHDVVLARGTRPSGLSLDYSNVFCALCSGCRVIRPLNVHLRCLSASSRPLDTLLDPLAPSQCGVLWKEPIKKCSKYIPLPESPWHRTGSSRKGGTSPLPLFPDGIQPEINEKPVTSVSDSNSPVSSVEEDRLGGPVRKTENETAIKNSTSAFLHSSTAHISPQSQLATVSTSATRQDHKPTEQDGDDANDSAGNTSISSRATRQDHKPTEQDGDDANDSAGNTSISSRATRQDHKPTEQDDDDANDSAGNTSIRSRATRQDHKPTEQDGDDANDSAGNTSISSRATRQDHKPTEQDDDDANDSAGNTSISSRATRQDHKPTEQDDDDANDSAGNTSISSRATRQDHKPTEQDDDDANDSAGNTSISSRATRQDHKPTEQDDDDANDSAGNTSISSRATRQDHKPTEQDDDDANDSAGNTSISSRARKLRLAELCNSFTSYVIVSDVIYRNKYVIYRNKYCYLMLDNASLDPRCSFRLSVASSVNFLYTYQVTNVLTSDQAMTVKPNKRVMDLLGITTSVNSSSSAGSSPAARGGTAQAVDTSGRNRCNEPFIQRNNACLPTMYTVRLMLDVNFTAASGSVFKSVVGMEDLNNITEDLLQAMQTQDNVTTCVSGGVHVWNRSAAWPHQWVQLMPFSCHVDANDTVRLPLFLTEVTDRMKVSFTKVVELVGNPAVILFTVCILPHPDHGHTRASTTKAYCSENRINIVASRSASKTRTITTEGYITIVCCVLSDVGLLIRIALQCVVPFYNSFAGRIQLCLCISLLLAYSFFLVGGVVSEGSTSCAAIGVMTHLAFLSALFWMNTTAREIWKTFRDWKSQAKARGHASLLLRALYAVGAPVFIVGVALVLGYLAPDNPLSPHYGHDSCWLNRPYAVIGFFVVPCSIICFINVFFVASTVRGLRQQRSTVVELQKYGSRVNPVSDVAISFKVVVLVGITWMLGLLAAFVDNAVLWLLFTLVNASLGFFIAIVLVCNRRVMSTLLRSCRPRPPDPCTAVQSAQTTTPKF